MNRKIIIEIEDTPETITALYKLVSKQCTVYDNCEVDIQE